MSRTRKERREAIRNSVVRAKSPYELEEEAIRRIDAVEAAKKITPEQIVRAIRLLPFLADGCAFVGSRRFQSGLSCGQDTGKGYDCSNCAARALLKELL